jgi:hypothetical protein
MSESKLAEARARGNALVQQVNAIIVMTTTATTTIKRIYISQGLFADALAAYRSALDTLVDRDKGDCAFDHLLANFLLIFCGLFLSCQAMTMN